MARALAERDWPEAGRELTLAFEGGTPRTLRDIYRRLSAASRSQTRLPGFWTTLATNMRGRRRQ